MQYDSESVARYGEIDRRQILTFHFSSFVPCPLFRTHVQSWLGSSGLVDENGKNKRLYLEDLKKRFLPSLKTLVKESKAFCREESSASVHLATFGRALQESLYQRKTSMNKTTDAMKSLARILGDADRSEAFLTSRFTRTIEGLHQTMPDLHKKLDDVLVVRSKLYKKLCSQRDLYDSTLEKARRKRQKKGGLFGLGKKQTFNNAPEFIG